MIQEIDEPPHRWSETSSDSFVSDDATKTHAIQDKKMDSQVENYSLQLEVEVKGCVVGATSTAPDEM